MIIILTALIVSLIAPAVLALITNHQRRQEKREDWARQDEVARRAAVATQQLVEANKNTSDKLQILDDGQKVIHTLVNQDKTDSLERDLRTWEIVVLQAKRLGEELTPDQLRVIESIRQELADRAAQLNKAEAFMSVEDAAASRRASTGGREMTCE